jgi:predicted membrane channel-forming protein YqfA (hemolysin III family)
MSDDTLSFGLRFLSGIALLCIFYSAYRKARPPGGVARPVIVGTVISTLLFVLAGLALLMAHATWAPASIAWLVIGIIGYLLGGLFVLAKVIARIQSKYSQSMQMANVGGHGE